MNIYEMYVHHWKQVGFWVWRITWGNTIAKVTHIGKLFGPAPYFGNPEVIVDLYDIHTGELKTTGFVIESAGTYKTWRWVQPPAWSNEPAFDVRAGRLVLNVPFAQNSVASRIGARWSDMIGGWYIPLNDEKIFKKAEKHGFMEPVPPPTPPAARVYFSVPIEQKDIAKSVKAMWHPDLRLWHLPCTDTAGISTLQDAGFGPVELEPEEIKFLDLLEQQQALARQQFRIENQSAYPKLVNYVE